MKEKSKSIIGKLIDITDKNNSGINVSFVSHQDVQLNIIKKDNKSSDVKNEDNKELTSFLSDIESGFKQTGIPLKINQENGENQKNSITGQNPGKASLSDAEIVLQKMQLQAQELGAELVLTDRPDIMSEEPWKLPEISSQEFRSADIPAAEGLAKLSAVIKTVTDKCPLQISLMIQADIRPQVMMKVSAGEVNWIFAAKEGRYPLKDVLDKMAGKTVTHGWDAIVVYQRGQANNLLMQQHIRRFITGNSLPPLNDDIESSSATRLLTHNLTLSAPHLSFSKPGTGDPTAQVTMDFMKGMIVYKEKTVDDNYRIMKIEKITPLNSPFVAMDVPLLKAPGSVSDIGEVQLDIKEGEHFANNLVVNGMEKETISNFFKRKFDATPAEQRIYSLGTISNYEHEQFQPEEFVIRTIGAPNTESRGSQDEGDGAVVLFVQVKDGNTEQGKTEADWLLADDYSSALVVSNYQLLDKMARKQTQNMFGYDIQFGDYSADTGEAGKIKVNNGLITKDFKFEMRDPFTGMLKGTFSQSIFADLHDRKIESVSVPFQIRSSYTDEKCDICYEYKFDSYVGTLYYEHEMNSSGYNYVYSSRGNIEHPEVNTNGKYLLHLYFKAIYNAVINDGVISFIYSPDKSTYLVDMDENVCLSGCNNIEPDTVDNIVKDNKETIKNQILDDMKISAVNLRLHNVNTFTLRNLLFPGENYFHADYARVPGDLLVMGQLGAGSESFSVTPGETTIVAGSVCQFKTTPDVQGVKWSISDSEKGNTGADLGTIDTTTGKYTAPQAAAVTEGVRHVVVCAEKGDTKVYALASVIAKGVSISPAYQVVQPDKTVKLTANSVNGGELKWDMGKNKQGSSLTKVINNEYTYKAGKKVAKLNLNLERVTVTDENGASGEALILIPNSSISGKITVSYDNVPADSVKLIYTVVVMTPALDENGDQIYDEDDNPVFEEKEVELTGRKANWTAVETGGATFDQKTGILTSAPGVGDGFAVIRVAYTEGTTQYRSAIVIPLPLSTYKKTILQAYSPEQA